MSLFANGIVPQRNSRIRSLGGDHLTGNINSNQESNTFNENDKSDHYKDSLLSASTKSTSLDSPPPRCVSFPTNLHGIEKDDVFEHGIGTGIDNPVFGNGIEAHPLPCNGKMYRPFSSESRRAMKRNGTNPVFNAPRVTITADCENDSEPTKNDVNKLEQQTDPLSKAANGDLAPVEG